MASEPRRLRAALSVTLGYGVALGAAVWALSFVTPVTGPDASGALTVAMVVAAVAGFLAVLLRLSGDERAVAIILLPPLGAGAGFLLSGGVLFGLGGGDPLAGPIFALSQFTMSGIWLAIGLAVVAAAAFRMGTSPRRDDGNSPVG